MPKIKSYTPAWLSKPAPGHNLFTASKDDQKSALLSANAKIKPGPRRTIAQSGSQVFVAVGREVRWADLIQLKDQWQEQAAQNRRGSRIKREDSFGASDDDLLRASAEDGYAGFRTLRVSVGADIQELVISPYGDYLAVLTSYTVRICAVPDLSLLSVRSNEIIKPKTWTLGPTTHVMDRSSIASALWHPLGVNGSTLITVTTDAVVRVWELSATDRWSFDTPTLNIDLRKLADGTYLDENFSARPDVTSKGFSADSFEMDVAAACFGRRGSGGWSPMTLWVAMREGDVYALCPLLPTRWCPPPTLIPSLSVSIVGNLAAIEDDPKVSPQAKLLAQQQLDWMSELDNQEPLQVKGPPEEPVFEVYTRPSRPGVVPRLQGPFELELGVDAEVDMDLELSDIFVIGQKLDTDELMMGEDEDLDVDDIDQDGLSLSIVCLLSASGQLRVCLDLDGVQAQWLPPRNKTKGFRRQIEDTSSPSLVTFETLDTLGSLEMTEDGWPMFSPDVTSRYSFYVTHPAGITHISLSPWVFRLETELQGDSQAGSDFRIDLLTKTSSTRERLYTNPVKGDAQVPLAAAVAIRDPDLGYFLLSATPFEPVAIIFDAPESELEPIRSISPVFDRNDGMPPLTMYEPRPTFQPSHAFNENSALPHLLERLRTSRHKAIVTQEVRLSPVTLQVFTDAHKILSEETYRLGLAASELFRRLETLQSELKQQITKANEVKARVEAITGEDQEASEPESSNDAIERRLAAAKTRGEAISQRLERMRKKVSRATSRELSESEVAWIKEVNAVNASISGTSPGTTEGGGAPRLRQLGKRYNEAKALKEALVAEAEKLTRPSSAGSEDVSVAPTELRIPQELRRAKINDVRRLLERETALVDAVKSRLEKLEVDV